MKCSYCGGSNFKEYDGSYICKDCGTKNEKPSGATTMSATTSSAVGVCAICGGKDFKEYNGKQICKNCGSPLSTTSSSSTTTTTTPNPKPMSTTTSSAVGVCAICGGKDFKEYNGKKICKNCGSPLSTTSASSTTTSTPKPASSTSTTKPVSTGSTEGVCAICGGKDFKDYLGKKICKNCGSPLSTTSSSTTSSSTTTTTTTSTTTPPTSNPKPTTKSSTTSKPKPAPVEPVKPVEDTVTPTPVSYKYDFSIMFKPSVKLFGFESFTKDKKIADDILHYLISKKYTVSEGYGESSDNEIYSKAVIVIGTKADYIDSRMKEKLNCYKRDSERNGKPIVYYVYDKTIPSGLPIDVTDGDSFNADGDDFLEKLSKRFLDESNK